MNELFTLVAFSVLRLSGIRDGRMLLACRTAVTGDAVLVDPSANVGAELLFELPEHRPLGDVHLILATSSRWFSGMAGKSVARIRWTVSYFEKSRPRNSTLSAIRTAESLAAPNSTLCA